MKHSKVEWISFCPNIFISSNVLCDSIKLLSDAGAITTIINLVFYNYILFIIIIIWSYNQFNIVVF